MEYSGQNVIETCSKCDQVVKTGEAVYLWDGRVYCTECVRQASPKLLEYARTHSQYDESFEVRERRLVRVYLKYQIILLALILVSSAVGFLREPLAAIPFVLSCALLWYGVNRLVPNRLRHWEVCIAGGIVFVQEFADSIPAEARLEGTHWQIADAREATGWLFFELPHERAILLLIGPLKTSWLDAPPLKIPCGVSPDTFEVLAAFLTLSGIPNAAGKLAKEELRGQHA